jgi:hypothetical protein
MSATPDYTTIAESIGADCPLCGHSDALVAPDCTEGHGADCPDRVCMACGSALFVDPAVAVSAQTAKTARTAPTARTA